tara:strand:- start:324 stop:458 length:135 start_codon:yes stop_codon:yes gene_type:complete
VQNGTEEQFKALNINMLEEAQIEALVRLLKESVVEEVIGEQDEN